MACSINNENLLHRNSSSVYSLSYSNQLKEILHLFSVVNTDDILAIVNILRRIIKALMLVVFVLKYMTEKLYDPEQKIGIHSC